MRGLGAEARLFRPRGDPSGGNNDYDETDNDNDDNDDNNDNVDIVI